MSKFKNKVDAQKAHILSLRIALLVLGVVCALMWYGWKRAPDTLTIHVPPDLRTGSTRLWWDIPAENVYGFGLYIFSQINRWPTNGEDDYRRAIFMFKNFLTPGCRIQLENDYERRRNNGELRNRVRGVYEILGRGYVDDPGFRVRQVDKDSWVVTLDMTADEYYLTESVKRALVRYPLRVVRFDVDAEHNPYGLALDCFERTPQALTPTKEES